jgi:hypothetical protein
MYVLNWMNSKDLELFTVYIWCFKSFVLFGFSLSFVPYFFQIVFW